MGAPDLYQLSSLSPFLRCEVIKILPGIVAYMSMNKSFLAFLMGAVTLIKKLEHAFCKHE